VLPGTVLLETKGRRSDKPRRTPVGGRLDGNTLWIVAEFGRKANYVRNIEADPKVRVRFKGRWRSGTAATVPDDDPRERLRFIKGMNSRTVRLVGTDLLSIRIDLEPR
jgi:deazaflavin-dependent oxidoreductase (nitroreductase family)